MATPWSSAFPKTEAPPTGTPAWYVRENSLARNRWRARAIVSNAHRDADVVDGPIESDDAHELWRTDVDPDGHSLISLNPAALRNAPSLWFVVVPDLGATRPAMMLAGFATDHVAPGTVLTNPEFFSLPVQSTDQVGAIRWWHLEGVVDQVFVAEQWRRRFLGTALIYAENAYQVNNDCPSKLTSDGRRTELGEQLAAATLFPDRFAPLETLSPPTDPSRSESPPTELR